MTDEHRGTGAIAGPPWSVDTLADLHAGVFDAETAARLWAEVDGDRDAMAVIEALNATGNELAALAEAPPAPMPEQYAARIDAALADEAAKRAVPAQREQGLAPVVSMDAARRKRRQRLGWGAGVLTAAAAAVAAVAILVPGSDSTGGTPVAQPSAPSAPSAAPNAQAPLALRQDNMAAALGQAMNARDFGPMGTEQKLDQCLQANGVAPGTRPAGVKAVTVDGQPATLVILTTGKLGQFRLLAMAPNCAKVFDNLAGG